jgi:hypothetical protein
VLDLAAIAHPAFNLVSELDLATGAKIEGGMGDGFRV